MKNKIIGGLLLLAMGTVFLQSCAGGKAGCGCGTDINRAYKMPKRYH
jgi:hypothetical protein